jgi:polysaccharide export outer membrane protein
VAGMTLDQVTAAVTA